MTKVSDFSEQGLVFKEKPTVHNFKDIEGCEFGRLVVMGFAGSDKCRESLWYCKCSCGNIIRVKAANLRTGHTKSCGCFNVDVARERATTHGHKANGMTSRTYITWRNMISRCYNPNDANYHHYGGRGIAVCDRWRKFENFLADMGERPLRMTIERIDNNNGYFLDNCRYATQKEQCNNKRSNRYLTFNGKTQTISQWSDEIGISQNTIERRLNGYGWTVEQALTKMIHERI